MTTQAAPATELDALDLTVVQETDDAAREESLYFYPEAAAFRTPFRDSVCRELYRDARELAGDDFDGANVTPFDLPGDDDSWSLVLTVFVKAGYERRSKIAGCLAKRLSAISQNWSRAEKLDCQKRVHFDVFPAGS